MNTGEQAAILPAPLRPATEVQAFRPHDLLWIADWHALQSVGPLPSWANGEWMAHAPVVVRRERIDGAARIPVGLRGRTRGERHAAYLEPGAVLRRLSPEMLAREAAWQRMPGPECIAAVAALKRIAPQLDASGLHWGPAGSVGYALACGLPVLRAESDLDLLVRCDTPPAPDQALQLQAMFEGHGCRIDVQIDTGHGGFALAEWLRGDGRVLLKTGMGPFLTSDPWNCTGWLDDACKEAA